MPVPGRSSYRSSLFLPSPGSGMTELTAAAAAAAAAPSRRRTRWWVSALAILLLLGAIAGAAGLIEMRSSRLQAHYISRLAAGLDSRLGAGPSAAIRFPGEGPYDLRAGYSRIPQMTAVLERNAFVIDSQAVVSERFLDLVDRGFSPIYHAKDQAGFQLLDRRGDLLYDGSYPGRVYPAFDSIPVLVWRTLLFVEDRGLLEVESANYNPAINWPRLFRAATDLGGRRLGRGGPVAGASTLATQIEKFRHAPEGRTASPRDKLQQMASASIRAYLDGPETLEARRGLVTTYLNSAPFAGIAGFGEVIGFGDALWAWYGADFEEVNGLLREAADSTATLDPLRHGRAYRKILQLVMAVQRPSYFLADSVGRDALNRRADRYLELMAREGVVSPALAAAARAPVEPRRRALETPLPSFIERKAVNAARGELLTVTGIQGFYQLDRIDLTARTTIDGRVQAAVTDVLRRLRDPAFLAARGLIGPRLLASGDPTRVNYAFLLYERTGEGNVVRVQVDNVDGPFSPIEGAKLELGSTAKLRTLVSYLEIVERVYRELNADSVAAPAPAVAAPPDDQLTAWVRGYLRSRPAATLAEILDAAMDRSYSASPRERFFTGGGVHTFGNFESSHDNQSMPVRAAFRQSVNLVFIRMMRDVVYFHMNRLPNHPAGVLSDRADRRRREYLARFADREGQLFLDRFLRKHTWTTRDGALDALVEDRILSPSRLAWAFRSADPSGTAAQFVDWLEAQGEGVSSDRARELFDRAEPDEVTLVDRGFLAGIHPLELWLVAFRLRHPAAGRAEVMDSSRDVRQQVYQWLFATRHSEAQNQRIRSILEVEAFFEVHRAWKRLGYPFASLVPSYATAIGTSADRPDQLAELVGILINDGVRQPSFRIDEVRFAAGTPYETLMSRHPGSQRLLSSELAAVVREAMIDVVERGTARRAYGAVRDSAGAPLRIGAKTGTGNNRFRVVGRGGQVLQDRAINRTSTVVFFIGDRFYGTFVAFVPGAAADDYDFTSSLPAHLLQILGPALTELAREPPQH